MYNKLVIIVPREFSVKEYTKNSIEDFIKKKIKIEIWIVKKILNSLVDIDKKLLISNQNITFKIINNFTDLRENLSHETKSTLFDLRIKLNTKTKNFFFTFFEFDFDFLIISGLQSRNFNLFYRIFLNIKNLAIQIIFLINKIKIKPSKYVFLLGEKSDIKFDSLVNKKSILIKGHHADYDRFLEKKEDITKIKKDYFVFIDQNVPFHQDLVEMNKNDINENKYYLSIKNFLEITKKKYGIDYFISAHPRSDINRLKKFFGESVSQLDTLETIRQCKFVLCHDSIATNYAFLFNKPIISIYNDELANSKYNHLKAMKRFCQKTRSPLKNVHRDQIENDDLIISEEFYSKFISNFIKCHNENKKRIDIITENINFL